MPSNRIIPQPSSTPMRLRFWSDSNLTNFKRDLMDAGVSFREESPGSVNVYDSNPAIKTLAMDYGGEFEY